jgi:hypothetical protein
VAVDAAVEVQAARAAAPAPAPLFTVAGPASSLEMWPYTASLIGAAPSDPMNVVFPDIDPRSLRAALMMLDGNRTAFGFPDAAPFNCTWKEAMGSNQVGYASPVDWTASAIQLECGDYAPLRFHIRMFPSGDWTIANAHFEVIVPGTNEHEVLAWELAEQLVTVDFVRSGLLVAPPSGTQVITPEPTFRAINPLIYSGLPPELQGLIGGPIGPVTDPVPMANDGRATVLALGGPVGNERVVSKREFVLDFDQTIPKPFCSSGPLDYLYVTGPIRFTQQVVVARSGNYMTRFHARGQLELTPINPLTGEMGEPLRAQVAERDRSVVTDQVTMVSTFRTQLLLPKNRDESGSIFLSLRVGPGTSDGSGLRLTCTS